ncbi:hypothetical protein ACIQNU_17665 [Streptomyces sp. NPDC091292]|uniref:hypothetical protein n=1 Tax=Streptomyces sp. NPDC091292 TaxID=3365991 RepID=UPI00381745A1
MSSQPSHLSAPGHIAGLVDGSITLQRDSSGGLSLTLGPTGPTAGRDGAVIEIGLTVEAASQLSRLLLDRDGSALDLPCQVGVRTQWA